jgi:hypothetical protein
VIRRALAGLAGVLVLAGPASAGEARVEPDRPSVSTSARTVPPGAVQVEAGVAYERTRLAASAPERRFAVQGTVRVGLLERLEARVDAEPLVDLHGAAVDTGAGDVALGLKYLVLDAPEGSARPALGVLPFAKIPTADEPRGSGRADVGLLGLATFDLPAGLGLDVNAGVVVVGQARPRGHLGQAVASAALSREVAERLAAFVELFYASRGERGGRDTGGVDAGLAWWPTPRLALDAAVGLGLLGPSPDYVVRAGLSVRLGR